MFCLAARVWTRGKSGNQERSHLCIMRPCVVQTVLFLTSFTALIAQDTAERRQTSTSADLPAFITERGPNHRVWSRETYATNQAGEVSTQALAIVELATGMHRWGNGEWAEARPSLVVVPGAALGTNTAHQVKFSANLNTVGAVDLLTPDGQRLRSHVAGVSYSDTSTKQAVLVAAVQDSYALVVGDTTVVYTNAFDAIQGDIEYELTAAGAEQNVVWREELPSPALLNLNPDTTWVQVLTEFDAAPEPTQKMESNGFVDSLDFGVMKIGKGRGFPLGLEAELEASVAVGKQWVNLAGRRFLVESIPYTKIAAQLRALGRKKEGAALPAGRRGRASDVTTALAQVLPPAAPKERAGTVQLAQLDLRMRPGFVLDYTILSGQADFTFAGNTNYYVSGLVNLTGTTTIEGGTIIKFTNHPSAKISMSGPLICKTEAYRPAVLTSKDDNTVGETITGSTGSPTNYNGGTYLYSSLSDPTNAIQYLRLSYAGTGLAFDGLTNGAWHCQFVKCQNAIDSYNQKEVRLYNVLMAVCSNAILNSTTVRGQHLTVDVCSNLVSATSPSLALTNSLLTAVAVIGAGSPTYDQVGTATSGAGIYQTVGGASYYLAAGSTNRNLGTTNISSALAGDLRSRTTYPPILLTNYITSATVLSPEAQRDTDVLDLGYHYDPLDFVAANLGVSANLTLANGVVVGVYGTSGQAALYLSAGSFVSEGLADRLNWIARYNTVQEQSSTNWSGSTVGYSVWLDASNLPVQVRFTGWSLLGGSGTHFNDFTDGTNPSLFTHCRFSGGNITVDPGAVAFTNCLLERTYTKLQDDADYGRSWYLYNNLFYGGTLWYRARGDTPDMRAYDNLFDRTVITKGSRSASFSHDYNGYVTNQNRLTPSAAHDVVLTNKPVYATSYLGRYYYPTDDGMLSTLIDAGSRTADSATLYHFTSTTDQNKETTSQVNIGFHYVAVDSSGQPLDTDGDGVTDYLEDRDGNGAVDSGETDWNAANDMGLKVFIAQPKRTLPVP